MPIRFFDPAYRLALRAAYPLMCRWQKASGRRSRVAIVAVWHGGEILVVRHSYRPGMELPGGNLRQSETPVQAAARELREEVGVQADPRDLRAVAIPNPWRRRLTLFEYRPTTRPRLSIDNREIVEAFFRAPSQVVSTNHLLHRYLENAAAP